MPLRASNINYSDLRHIVLVGNIQFLARWRNPLEIIINLGICTLFYLMIATNILIETYLHFPREWTLLKNLPKVLSPKNIVIISRLHYDLYSYPWPF